MIEKGDLNLLLQDEGAATFCKKIKKEDARIDFSAPPRKVCALINAMSPSPAAFAYLKGAPVNIFRAYPSEGEGQCGAVLEVNKRGVKVACGGGAVLITEAQFAGGKRLSAPDIFNGRKISAGDILE